MNPPFRVSSNPFQLPYHRFEIAAGGVFSPGQSFEAQAQFSWRMHPHLIAGSNIQSNFSDRFSLNLNFGYRLQVTDFLSLDFRATGGLGWLFDQNRTQGALQENLRLNGTTAQAGATIYLNANLFSGLGFFTALSYQHEFCADVRVSPDRLPHSRNAAVCDDSDLVALSAGVIWGFYTPNVTDNENDSESPQTPTIPAPNLSNDTPMARPRLRDVADIEVISYIENLDQITNRNVYHRIEEVAQETDFSNLSFPLQKMLILKAIEGSSANNLILLCQQLLEIQRRVLRERNPAAIENYLREIENLFTMSLHPITHQEITRLNNQNLRNGSTPYSAYIRGTESLAVAYLHIVLNPRAQNRVKNLIQNEAMRWGIHTEGLQNFRPELVTVADDRLAILCHTRDPLLGCANVFDRIELRKAFIAIDRNSPHLAYETIVHENMHLFSTRMRELSGCTPANRFSNRGRFQYFTDWLEEAINEEESSDIYRSQSLVYRDIEAFSSGREALQVIQSNQNVSMRSLWRSLHLFCRGDDARQQIGDVMFRQLTEGYRQGDFDGGLALRRVRAFYSH